MSSQNTEVVRRMYDAMNAGDVAAMRSVVDPEFEWIPAEDSPFDEAYRGRDRALRFVEEEWFGVFDDLHAALQRVIEAPADVVVALVHLTGRGKASGVELAIDIAHLWTLRDGVVVQCRAYPQVKKALEAAGLEALPATPSLEEFDS